jgi:hypothetical protein
MTQNFLNPKVFQRGGLLKRKKQSAEDKAFTPELVQQRVKEYEAQKSKSAKPASQPAKAEDKKPAERESISIPDSLTFSQATAKAKKDGIKLFTWRGKAYRADK